MIYHVQAKVSTEAAELLLNNLTDGMIAVQRPDGPGLVASMDRAVVNSKREIE